MGKSAPSYSERPLSEEEKRLLTTQSDALAQSMSIALSQLGLSTEDRSYFEKIYRGQVDPNDPKVVEKAQAIFNEKLSAPDEAMQTKIAGYKTDNDKLSKELETLKTATGGVKITQKVKDMFSAAPENTDAFYTSTQEYDAAVAKWANSLTADQIKKYGFEGGNATTEQTAKIKELENTIAQNNAAIAEGTVSQQDKNNLLESIKTEVAAGMGTKGVDEMLFDAVKKSDTTVSTALSKWAVDAQKVAGDLNIELKGISGKFAEGIQQASSQYESKVQASGQKLATAITGLTNEYKLSTDIAQKTFAETSNKFLNNYQIDVNKYVGGYEQLAAKTAANMGKADTDIYAQTKGALTAGISSSYAEARKELESTLARRGLAGTAGVEAGALTGLSTQEAMAKTGALSQAYTQAIAASDARRQQLLANQAGVSQLGIGASQYGTTTGIGTAGTMLESGLNVAGNALQTGVAGATTLYGGEINAAGSVYGTTATSIQQQAQMEADAAKAQAEAQAQIAAQQYNMAVTQQQQNIANLSQLSGISQGVYTGAQNYLSGAASTTANVAQTSGSTATQLGQNAVSYYNAQTSAAATESAGFASALGTVAAAGLKYYNPTTGK